MRFVPNFLTISLLLVLVAGERLNANPGSYSRAETELTVAWDIKYPLPFRSVEKKDPMGRGIQQVKRQGLAYWMYNFEVFMPKYKRDGNSFLAKEEGRTITVYFLWNPNLEDPYRIELGEPSEGN